MQSIKDQALVVLTNVPDVAVAQRIARALVTQRLAACVNIVPGVQSVYQWQGAVEEAGEISLLIKTTPARYADVEAAIRALHPYELPEVIALPIAAGLPAYLAWITEETRKDFDV